MKRTEHFNWVTWALALVTPAFALWVWLSALAFVPVPWPDDSAFYFVAHEFFKWPPRWVMLPQAPFEPTYRIFNFNTMPLYPLLIGVGRWIGIDGSFWLKLWPLGFWAATGSVLAIALRRARLPIPLILLILAAFSLDPELRWASVLVRPESLIGLCGMMLVLKQSFEQPSVRTISLLLAIAAYAHFNAVHLVFPVVFAYASRPRVLAKIAGRTALYLSPWALVALWHFKLFLQQMNTQWTRLQFPNDWLSSPGRALASLFQSLGSPDPWPLQLEWASLALWILIFLSLLLGVLLPIVQFAQKKRPPSATLAPAAGWILGAAWLWHTKPEVWFMIYLHLAIWCFAAVWMVSLWNSRGSQRIVYLTGLCSLISFTAMIFLAMTVAQNRRLSATQSWNWPTYDSYIDCIDSRLSQLEQDLGRPALFRVWAPTFPDVTIELSRRHRHWEFTRTNDFWNRADLAVQHGRDVEAVVVAETLRWPEATISAPASEHPELQSVWMTWKQHFLNRLWSEPDWKPSRFICQRGRWQAYLFMKK